MSGRQRGRPRKEREKDTKRQERSKEREKEGEIEKETGWKEGRGGSQVRDGRQEIDAIAQATPNDYLEKKG